MRPISLADALQVELARIARGFIRQCTRRGIDPEQALLEALPRWIQEQQSKSEKQQRLAWSLANMLLITVQHMQMGSNLIELRAYLALYFEATGNKLGTYGEPPTPSNGHRGESGGEQEGHSYQALSAHEGR